MTREEAIKRWSDIAETVFWAEGAIAKEWNPKLKAMVGKPSDEWEAFAHEYCRAIAIEITNATSDEELHDTEKGMNGNCEHFKEEKYGKQEF